MQRLPRGPELSGCNQVKACHVNIVSQIKELAIFNVHIAPR